MEVEGGKKKRSFSYEIGDQKLKLIDISSEEDCLISSPLFDSLEDLRLSVTVDNIYENDWGSKFSRSCFQRDKTTKSNQQKELHLSCDSTQPGRPSYLRRSFAWDNSFFTNAGLLDQHELTVMNKGVDTLEEHILPVCLEDVCAGRPDLQSVSDIATSECYEFSQFKNRKVPVHGSKHMFNTLSSCCESALEKAGLKRVLASKKVGTTSRDMVDGRAVSKRKNINTAIAQRSKTEPTCKRRVGNSIDLKLPKAPRMKGGASTWQSKISSLEMYPVDVGGKKRIGAGRDLMLSNSITLLSSQKISPSITSSPLYETSAYARKTRETGKSKLFTSVSTSKIPIRSSTKSKTFENFSSSMESPRTTTSDRSLESSSSTSITSQAHSNSNFGLNMPFGPTENYRSPTQLIGAVASAQRKNAQPSGLCMPSPKIGFFDEDKLLVPTLDESTNRSQKQGMATTIETSADASTKVKRPRRLAPSPTMQQGYAASLYKVKNASCRASDAQKDCGCQSDKFVEIESKVWSKLRKVGNGEHDRKKVGVNPRLKADVKGILKTKLGRERMILKDEKGISKLRMQENEVNDVSRYLELIDLNDGKETQKMNSPHKRTPLIQKN